MGASSGIGKETNRRHAASALNEEARAQNLLALNNIAKIRSAFWGVCVCVCVCFVLVAKDAEELSEDPLKLLSRVKEM